MYDILRFPKLVISESSLKEVADRLAKKARKKAAGDAGSEGEG